MSFIKFPDKPILEPSSILIQEKPVTKCDRLKRIGKIVQKEQL